MAIDLRGSLQVSSSRFPMVMMTLTLVKIHHGSSTNNGALANCHFLPECLGRMSGWKHSREKMVADPSFQRVECLTSCRSW